MALQFRCIEKTVSDDWARFKFETVPNDATFGHDCPRGSLLMYFTNHDYFDAYDLSALYDWESVLSAPFLAAPPVPELDVRAAEPVAEPDAEPVELAALVEPKTVKEVALKPLSDEEITLQEGTAARPRR